MAKFYQVSENHFVDEKFNLLSKVNLQSRGKNQYILVPYYLSTKPNETLGFNFNDSDTIRHYEKYNYTALRNIKFSFTDAFGIKGEFYNRTDKKKHTFSITIQSLAHQGFNEVGLMMSCTIDDNNALLQQLCNAKSIY